MEKTLLERQVEALRVSIEPGGRWDRLASGDVQDEGEVDECALCEIDCTYCSAYCPLAISGHMCYGDYNNDPLFERWEDATGGCSRDGCDHPPAVALAREMKALLARLLVEYEAKLEEERKNA